jgi:hypothetical protein
MQAPSPPRPGLIENQGRAGGEWRLFPTLKAVTARPQYRSDRSGSPVNFWSLFEFELFEN